MGSGMGSMKQFMLSILATTVSIALTFGTAAIIDNNKKENEKHQILMMVLCDMKASLDEINAADSLISGFVDAQAAFLANPDSLETEGYMLMIYYNELNYNKTVENIFNSNIESINTIGNINFVEKASDFYRLREYYNENIAKEFAKMMENGNLTSNYDSLANSREMAEDLRFVSATRARMLMQEYRACEYRACRTLANVSDEEMEAYYESRMKLEDEIMHNEKERAVFDSLIKDRKVIRDKLEKAYQEGRLKRQK